MISPAVTGLRQADARLQQMLEQLQTGSLAGLRAQEMAAWRNELKQAAAWMRTEMASGTEPARLRAQFRDHLQEFYRRLPLVEAYLLTERARLEVLQNRISNSTAWAEANRKTL